MSMPRVLSIAGSDSSGGAGIQADLKTLAALGCYGMTAVTAVTAQNTLGVCRVMPVPPEMLRAQIDAVVSDIGVDAIKIGMLATPENAQEVGSFLASLGEVPTVLDPVMAAQGGDGLNAACTADALVRYLMPGVTLMTPNMPEAERLTGLTVSSIDGMEAAARRLVDMGCANVLLKGGHHEGALCPDLLLEGATGRVTRFTAPRIETRNNHGTGCTLGSALAAYLARGASLPEAVDQAKAYITGALKGAVEQRLGKGHGPLDHFSCWRP
ncbi:bifunctional hydroxymethylpyrimidine kinase/phosphomethylpyrimidine kinase [Desulfoluna sp.]|uniref:bifunctional hydroxymethylpyrimidine kinase/phosphomethylpyrimidine kinase n=1 Tax=Desulfoluna sp. TaxID=2045199 RepID=UPI00260AC43A|nr:bifunctional hydroxymethylpyrimidine kinase/phosphomethylpyrimidine kinase [Desulfoluna sp.]